VKPLHAMMLLKRKLTALVLIGFRDNVACQSAARGLDRLSPLMAVENSYLIPNLSGPNLRKYSMRLISKSPFFLKYVIGPFFFIFGMIAAFAPIKGPGIIPFDVGFLFNIGAAVGGVYAVISGLSFADEVWDAGNMLIVHKFGYKESIPLANITSLTHKERRIPCSFLTLDVPCRFGRKIKFITILRGLLNWSGPDPALYDDLPMRIHEARQRELRNRSTVSP
jgi:hypothetical protein